MCCRRRTLRGRISDTRRAWSSMTTKGAHRRAVLMLLNERGHRACASWRDLDRHCFRSLSGVPWSEEETVVLLQEMERGGEIDIDWQQTLDGREVVSWVWLADNRLRDHTDMRSSSAIVVTP